MSIKDVKDKIKSFYKFFILLLVALASFGFGRLSTDMGGKEPIKILIDGEAATAGALSAYKINTVERSEAAKGFVASNMGKKYYRIDCPAGANLKEENKIYFDTREEAESAGYTASTSC